MKHWPNGPSSADRVMGCSGSVGLSKGLSSPSSAYAEEGTEAAELARIMLTENPLACVRHEDKTMAEHIEGYVTYIDKTVREFELIDEWVETTLESSIIPDCGGTPDYGATYRDKDGKLIVHLIELKYGAGIPVPVAYYHQGELDHVNYQLLVQACLVLEQLADPVDEFILTVYQPRVGNEPEESIRVSLKDVLDFRQSYIEQISKKEFAAGPHCRFCPAQHICRTLADKLMSVAQETFDVIITDDTRQRWESILELETVFKTLFENLKTQIELDIESGAEYENWGLAPKLSNRQWNLADDELLKKLSAVGIGKRIATKSVVLTPTQLENLGYGESIERFVVRRDLGNKLTRKNRRKSTKHTPVVDVFDKVEATTSKTYLD